MINAALEIPDYDPSKDIQAAKAAFEPLIAQAEELAAFSEKRLKEIDAELKTIQQEKVRLVLRLCIESRVSCNTGGLLPFTSLADRSSAFPHYSLGSENFGLTYAGVICRRRSRS